MKWINLSSSLGKHPTIYDEDFHCHYCGTNHKIDENGRIAELDFIGTSTAGMTPKQAEQQRADLAVRSQEVTEFYRH